MAGKAKTTPPELVGELVYLLPEEIELDEDTNVRPFSTEATEREVETIQVLAETIDEEGQTQAVEVRKVRDQYLLVDGHRRREAILLINAGKDAGELPLKIKAIVEGDMGDAQAFRHALLANIHRVDFTPMDFAADVKAIRERFPDAKGRLGTKWVADFLKVSPAQVTTHEKLLRLPKDIQTKIHEGIYSADFGFELSNVKPEERTTVLAAAARAQITENVKEGAKAAAGKAAKKAGATKKGGVKSKHVRKAAREAGAQKKVKSRTRGEIIEYFTMRDAPDWGLDGSLTREFLRVFAEEFVTGKCSDAAFDTVFDPMIEAAMKWEESKKLKRNKEAA